MEEKIHQHFGIGKDQSLASLDGEAKLMLKSKTHVHDDTHTVCMYTDIFVM